MRIFGTLVIALILPACTTSTKEPGRAPFIESLQTAVFTTKYVLEGHEITRVIHDQEDGAWQFFSKDPIEDFATVAKVVSLGQMIALDSSLLEVSNLKPGYAASRSSKGSEWLIEQIK
jgi:hypothetical protein